MMKHTKGFMLDSDRIRFGMTILGIDADYQIVVADMPDIVEDTAANEIQGFFRKAFMNIRIVPESQAYADKRILLGSLSNHKILRGLCKTKKIRIGDIYGENDGFHLTQIGSDIVIAGSNPRGALYGVYALENYIDEGIEKRLDIIEAPYFRKRMGSQGYYFSPNLNLDTDEFTEEKAEYLSRLGVNEYLSGDTCYNMNLHYYVQSDVFPFQEPPDEKYQRKVKAISAICSKYGIDYYHSIYEPTIVHEEDIGKYPPEALGRVRRPYGGDRDGMDWDPLCEQSGRTGSLPGYDAQIRPRV